MSSPARTQFAAVFHNEVRLNSRRIAPYVLMLFSIFNATLWSLGQGSSYYGQQLLAKYGTLWAINSDYYISHHFNGYAVGIFGLPIFTALIMAEPVRRDFRLEIDALIFSKPVSRTQYLLGKFFGSFFVLVCCQTSFTATLIFIQVFHPSGTAVLPFRLFLYLKHFLMIVVITYLLFAAIYFAVGTLTRNPKIVFGLAIAYYPFMFLCGLFLVKNLPSRWRVLLSPLMLSEEQIQPFGRSPEWVDRIVVSYTPIMFVNRALVILAAVLCLTMVCRRFRVGEPQAKPEKFSWLNLSTDSGVVYYDPPIPQFTSLQTTTDLKSLPVGKTAAKNETAVPSVTRAHGGLYSTLRKMVAAIGMEFRLLRSERSLIVIIPLAAFVSVLELGFYPVVPEVSFSAAYATGTAKTLLFFLVAMTVFYVIESMQRDSEVKIEPVLWAKPIPNSVLLLSKFLATLFLMLSVIAISCLTAIAIQLLRGHTPIELYPYLIIYSVIVIPTIVFMGAVSILCNVLLREKYLAYVVIVGVGAGLFYLYGQGDNHWLYNPALYRLWTYNDLAGAGSGQGRILTQRIYLLAVSCLCLSLAHLAFRRKPTKGLTINGRLGGTGWAFVITVLSLVAAVVTGSMIR